MKEEIQTLSQNTGFLRIATASGISLSNTFIEPDSELRSLFSLLDDPDERIAEAVTERIVSRGIPAMAPLAAFADRTSDPLALARAKRIFLEFNTDILTTEFETLSLDLAEGRRTAFEDGVYLIARYGNPGLDVEGVRSEIDGFAQMLNYRIANLSSALEVLDEVNHFFFEELRFRGNQAKFMEPENSYIDKVVERRTGIPISLAAVYLLVVRSRLGLPFSGASAPGHFLVRYDGLHSEPLFIDAFNGGVLLRERDIKHYLDSSGLSFNRQFLEPSPPRAILLRMIRNLIIVFNEHGNIPARTSFERFMRILAPNAEEGQAFLRGLED